MKKYFLRYESVFERERGRDSEGFMFWRWGENESWFLVLSGKKKSECSFYRVEVFWIFRVLEREGFMGFWKDWVLSFIVWRFW